MGSLESKNSKEKDVSLSSETVPSTPIQCAKSSNLKNLTDLDPRSPSENVVRTPIEVPLRPSTPSKPDEKLTAVQQMIDPRSPTDQFHRTPIVLQDCNTEKCPQKLHNKLLDNARRSIMYTPTLSTKVPINPIKCRITSPKLLESSPVSRKNKEKRKSFVGVLETNIDYTETNLDDYVKSKALSSNLTININDDSFSGSIIEQKNCDPRSPSNEILRTPIEVAKKIGEIDLNADILSRDVIEFEDYGTVDSLLKIAEPPKENIPLIKVNDEMENSSPEIVCEVMNDIVTDKNEIATNDELSKLDSQITNCSDEKPNDLNERNDSEILDEFISVENLTYKTEKSSAEKLRVNDDINGIVESVNEEVLVQKFYEPPIDLTADVQEFDRKLTKIIHEDDIFFKDSKIGTTNLPRNRTPMKDRNLIEEPRKNKLKVSDKPRKQDYTVSKIPVFRDKGKKLNYQCENTPPSSLDLNKKKKKQQPKWDSEKTMII